MAFGLTKSTRTSKFYNWVQYLPFVFFCCAEFRPSQAAESAEQLSEALLEDLLEDTARAAWAAEADRELESIAECRLQAPTLESMLLRMEEIQVRAALQKGLRPKRSSWTPKGCQQSVCYL